MTDFDVTAEASPELLAEIHRDASVVDRLSYDLEGGGHFDLVRQDHPLDVDVENAFHYKP